MSTVKVLSMNRADSIHFTKINEFGDMVNLTPEDMLFITGERDGEEVTKNVTVRDFRAFFSHVNTDQQWFIPIRDESKITWKWTDTASLLKGASTIQTLHDIDVAAMIPTVSSTENGLMTSLDKSKLDNLAEYELPIATTEVLGGIKPDGQSVVISDTGVLSAVAGMPMCTERVLNADGWDPDSYSQKIMLEVNVNNRNVIDYPPECIQIVSQHHVLTIKEETDGITFQCDSIPVNDITVYVTSMGEIRKVN